MSQSSSHSLDKSEALKERVAEFLAANARSGEVIALGSGTTADAALRALGRRIAAEGLDISGVCTSRRTAERAAESGIRVLSVDAPVRLDWGFDGADEVDPCLNLIKGKGAALLMEKILGRRVRHDGGRYIVIVGENKLVTRLNRVSPVPVEMVPEAHGVAAAELKALGALRLEVREGTGKFGPVITEKGNIILDVWFDDAAWSAGAEVLERNVKWCTGVVESGIFSSMATDVWVARGDGVSRLSVNSEGKLVDERLDGGKEI